jgi:hypothetical protein
MDPDSNIRRYMANRGPGDRYTSFDYCFNYFRSFRERGEANALVERSSLQVSCLQLGFYLASWGMYRGSTALLQHSARHLAPVIAVIASAPEIVWSADADAYSREVCAGLLETAARLRRALPDGATDTLVTKIMLGTFGCVPAFDQNFRTGSRLSSFGAGSLEWLGRFYRANRDVIETNRIRTIDFDTGKASQVRYTRAKVIDMIFFIEGGGSISSAT